MSHSTKYEELEPSLAEVKASIGELTAENVGEKMEASRSAFMGQVQKVVQDSMQQCYTSFAVCNQILFDELEAGSKELSVYRELFFLVNATELTQEKWQSLVQRLEQLRKEKLVKISNARKASN